MKTKMILVLVTMVVPLSFMQAQDLPPKHRGMHPTLQKDGRVFDTHGNQLGYITKEGKICDVTGKVLGVIAKTGEVTMANQKDIIGTIQKDGSFKSKNGLVVSVGGDGAIMAQGKAVGHVDKGYNNKRHACVIHCFFSEDYEEVVE